MQTIQSQNVPLWLSENGTLYKQLVCLEQYGIPIETQTTETNTFCGIAVGVGAIRFNPTYSAVCEANPTADQMTFDDMVRIQLAGNPIWFKVQYPSPGSTNTNIFLAGQAYVTNTTYTAQVNDAIKFTGTLTGSGTIDRTP